MLIIDTHKLETNRILHHIGLLEAAAIKLAEQGKRYEWQLEQMRSYTDKYLKETEPLNYLRAPKNWRDNI